MIEGDNLETKTIELKEEYLTLGQLLKHLDIISSGGMAKWYLSEYFVYVNQEEEQRRGRKLYLNDVIEFPNEELTVKLIEHRK